MLDLKEFLFLSMQTSFKRRIDQVAPPVSRQGRYKVLVIDKNPDRYVHRVMNRYREDLLNGLRRSRRLGSVEASKLISKWWRQNKWKLNVINNTEDTGTRGKIRHGGKDVVCPITQETINTEDAFHIVMDNGAVVVYTIQDLVSYLSSTGVFQCCLTRQPFHLPTITRLVKRANKMGIREGADLRSVYMERERIRVRRIEHDNRILAIEASCAAVMTEIMDSAANHDMGAERVVYNIQQLIPEWRQLVNDYIRLDARSCKSMIIGDRERVRRLRDTAYADPYHLLGQLDNNVIKERLDLCERQIARDAYYHSVFNGGTPGTSTPPPPPPIGTGFFGQQVFRPNLLSRTREWMSAAMNNNASSADSVTDAIIEAVIASSIADQLGPPPRLRRTSSGDTQMSISSEDESGGSDRSNSSNSSGNRGPYRFSND